MSQIYNTPEQLGTNSEGAKPQGDLYDSTSYLPNSLNLGEFHYLQKQLDDLEVRLQHQNSIHNKNFSSAQILTVVWQADWDTMPVKNTVLEIKKQFIKHYKNLLEKHAKGYNLEFYLQIWLAISSPDIVEILLKPKNELEEALLDWTTGGSDITQSMSIFENILMPSLKESVIFYGLRVLYLLSLMESTALPNSHNNLYHKHDFSEPNQILIITDYAKIPLYANLGFELVVLNSEKQTLDEIQAKIVKDKGLKLVIFESEHPESVRIFEKAEKIFLEQTVLNFDIHSSKEGSFFRDIAKKTVGVKL